MLKFVLIAFALLLSVQASTTSGTPDNTTCDIFFFPSNCLEVTLGTNPNCASKTTLEECNAVAAVLVDANTCAWTAQKCSGTGTACASLDDESSCDAADTLEDCSWQGNSCDPKVAGSNTNCDAETTKEDCEDVDAEKIDSNTCEFITHHECQAKEAALLAKKRKKKTCSHTTKSSCEDDTECEWVASLPPAPVAPEPEPGVEAAAEPEGYPCGEGYTDPADASVETLNPTATSLAACCEIKDDQTYSTSRGRDTSCGTDTSTTSTENFDRICNAFLPCTNAKVTKATKCYDTACAGLSCDSCKFLECHADNACLGVDFDTAGKTEVTCKGENSCGCIEPASKRGEKESNCASISSDQDVTCDGEAACYRASLIRSQDTVSCESPFSCSNDVTPYQTHRMPEVAASGGHYKVQIQAPTIDCSGESSCVGANLIPSDDLTCSDYSSCFGAETKVGDKNGEILCLGNPLPTLPQIRSTVDSGNLADLLTFVGQSCTTDDDPTTLLANWGTDDFQSALRATHKMLQGPLVAQSEAERAKKGLTCADFKTTKTLLDTLTKDNVVEKLTTTAAMDDPMLDALFSSGSCAKAHLRGTVPAGYDTFRNQRPNLYCDASYSCYKAAIKMEATCSEAYSCLGATFDEDFNCEHVDSCMYTVASKGSGTICCGPGCPFANLGTDENDKKHNGCDSEVDAVGGYEKCWQCEKYSIFNFFTKTKTGLIILCVFIVVVLIGVIVGLVFLKRRMMTPQIENLDDK